MQAVAGTITLTNEEYAALVAKAEAAEPEPLPDPEELVAMGNEWDARYKADYEELRQRKSDNQARYRGLVEDAFNRRLKSGNMEYVQRLIFHAYWNSTISCANLLHILCRNRGISSQEIISANSGQKCRDCDNRIPYTSKSDLQRGFFKLCHSCEQKAEQARQEEARNLYQSKAEEVERLKTMPYGEYLKTDHWQNLRKTMLRRAGYRCQTCNAQDKLHVHHRTYENRGDEPYSDLIVLCSQCHETFHKENSLKRSAKNGN